MPFGPIRQAFLEYARHYDGALNDEEKFDAICAMLNMPPGSCAPLTDEESGQVKSGLRALSDKTRRIIGITQYALLGRSYLRDNPSVYTGVVRKLIDDYVCDETDPDICATANLALYALTADLACLDPLALFATITYASKLQHCKRDSHFIHDSVPNMDKALNMLRLCVRAARHHVQARRMTIDDLAGILVRKYDLVFDIGGHDALEAEMAQDKGDPILLRIQQSFSYPQAEEPHRLAAAGSPAQWTG